MSQLLTVASFAVRPVLTSSRCTAVLLLPDSRVWLDVCFPATGVSTGKLLALVLARGDDEAAVDVIRMRGW